ncbi:hypothetical protein AX17_004683 [Amanita inopinata Kibby_2008]|nr:hypothetical protein AX17_004683 [Amanita inopinata Kibby_2008]
MDDHGYEPPSLPPPSTHPVTPQVIQPIQPSLGVMATMVFQDGMVNETSEHIATAVHCLAKSFLDGDANFILDIASIDRFLGNYIFDSFEDKVKAFQEAATEFKLLGYSIMSNGFVHHEKLSRSLSPIVNPDNAILDDNNTMDFPSIFGNKHRISPTHSTTTFIKQESLNYTPRLAPASFSDRNTTPPLEYITHIETPRPIIPINGTILDRRSPTAPPIMSTNIITSHDHSTSDIMLMALVDSGLTLPMDIDRLSLVAVKVLSRIGSKWMTILDDISDDIQMLTDGTMEQDKFNFIIEVANALAFNLKTIPFAIMSDLEYRQSLDFLADYCNSLQSAHLSNAQLRKDNCDLQKEIEVLKQHAASPTTITKTSKTQTAKKTPIKATMSSEQQAKMIANIISKHWDTSIEEAYRYSTMISMDLVHDIEDLIRLALGGQNLLFKKAITWCSWSSNDILRVFINSHLTDKEIELVTLTLGGQAAVAIKAPNVSFVKFMNIPTIDQRGHPIDISDYMECIKKDSKWKDIKIFKMPYYATPLKNPDAISAPIKIGIIDDEKGSQAAKVVGKMVNLCSRTKMCMKWIVKEMAEQCANCTQ